MLRRVSTTTGEHWMLIALTVAVALVGRHVRLADRINAPVHPATDWVASMILRGTLL
jgi:hypothetical protein